MSDQTAAAVRTRTDIFPDYVLSEPEWTAHVGVEEALNQDFEVGYVAVAVRVDPSKMEDAMAAAKRTTSRRPYAAMSDGYYTRVIERKDAITPHLVWACLRRHHPQITMGKVASLLNDGNVIAAREAALDLFGFVPAKKVAGAKGEAPADSTSQTSPNPSENAA